MLGTKFTRNPERLLLVWPPRQQDQYFRRLPTIIGMSETSEDVVIAKDPSMSIV